MNKAKFDDNITRFAKTAQAVTRYKIGRTKLVELAKRENAYIKVDGLVLIDTFKLDKALEHYAEVADEQ